MLDGEGGFTVWANALPASISVAQDFLPMGLAHHVRLVKDVAKDKAIRFSDVHFDNNLDIVELRKQMVSLAGL